jgi:probable F420-dependent oxidoreductase
MSHEIEFGAMVNNIGDGSINNPDVFADLARLCERQEYDIVQVPDHIVLPADLNQSEYPFNPDGKPPFDINDHVYDQFSVLSYVSAHLQDVAVGTNICIVPLRHPLLLLRQITSVNAMNDAGLELGVGVGWSAEEYDALDIPFAERGQRLDEFLEILDMAAEQPEFSYDGDRYSFQTVSCYPDVVGGVPTYVGGYSGATFRRVGQFADGWTAAWARPEEIADARERIMNAWRDFERPGEPEIAVTRPVDLDAETARDTDRPFVGDADDVIEDVERYIEAGVTRINIDYYDRTSEAIPETIRAFGEQVLPSFS